MQMLCEDKKRIDIPGIKKHPWFEGKTFDQCLKENNNQTLVKDKSHDSGLGNDAESISQEMKEWTAVEPGKPCSVSLQQYLAALINCLQPTAVWLEWVVRGE